jgi:hypothetical protein
VARTLLALDPGLGVSPADMAAGWGADEQASAFGPAVVETARGQAFLPGALELVVLPVAVNLASNLLYDLVRRIVARSRPSGGGGGGGGPAFDVVETTNAQGERVLIVRARPGQP